MATRRAGAASLLNEQWTIVNGLPMFARVRAVGDDERTIPIVHVHGFGISGRYMMPTAERLAADYPTYVPDMPGYGRSVKPKKTLTIPQLADALAAYLDAVGLEKIVFLGNSMGCLIGLEFAERSPDRTERAIFVSPAGGPNNLPLPRGIAQLALDATRESPRMATIAVPDYLRFGMLNALRLFHAMAHFPTIERFFETTVPTMIVVGERDPLVNKERAKMTLLDDHDVTLAIHRDAAHAINYSHSEFLAGITEAFVRDQSIEAWAAGREDVEVSTTPVARQRTNAGG